MSQHKKPREHAEVNGVNTLELFSGEKEGIGD